MGQGYARHDRIARRWPALVALLLALPLACARPAPPTPTPTPGAAAVSPMAAAVATSGPRPALASATPSTSSPVRANPTPLPGRAVAVTAAAGPSSIAPPVASGARAAARVRYAISAEGVAAADLNGNRVAQGGWGLWDADDYFAPDPATLSPGPVLRRGVETLGVDAWRVVQQHRDVRVVYDYVARGEDLHIRAEVTNNARDGRALPHLAFTGLTLRLPRASADRRVNRQHPSFFKTKGWSIAHPSYYNPLGAWMLRGGTANLGFVPIDASGLSKILLGGYDPKNLESWKLIYLLRQRVEAGQTAVARVVLRLSDDERWGHLLAPYKEEFDRVFPRMESTPDARPVGMCATSGSERVRPGNPLGFAADATRFDLEQGVRLFLETVADPLAKAGAQSCVFWDIQGHNPRGAKYRPDFDVFPPAVAANLPALVAGMKARGLKVGMLARPADEIVPASATEDTTRRVLSTDAAALARVWARFERMIDQGVSDFYLDSFGVTPDDVAIMAWLREKMRAKGADCVTYAEFGIDVMLPRTGYYVEVRFDEQKRELDVGPFTTLEDVRIFRWLVPGSPVVAQVRATRPAEEIWEFCMREKIQPMIFWWDARAKADLARRMTDRFIDPTTNQWR